LHKGHLQDHDLSAGDDDAKHFGERASAVGNIADAEGDACDVKAVVFKGKMQSVAFNDLNPVAKVPLLYFVFCRRDHFRHKVQAGDRNVRMFLGSGNRQIPRSAGDVQIALRLKKPHFLCGKSAPGHVAPEAQKPV